MIHFNRKIFQRKDGLARFHSPSFRMLPPRSGQRRERISAPEPLPTIRESDDQLTKLPRRHEGSVVIRRT